MIEYTADIAERICHMISEGISLTKMCDTFREEPGFPSRSTILRWQNDMPEFEAKCARARLIQADHNFDRCGQIVDDMIGGKITSDIARVAISHIQWRAAKLNSKRYGDKISNEHTGADGKPIETNMQVTFVKSRSKFAEDTTEDHQDIS